MVDQVGHVTSVIVSREIGFKTMGYDVAPWPNKLKSVSSLFRMSSPIFLVW